MEIKNNTLNLPGKDVDVFVNQIGVTPAQELVAENAHREAKIVKEKLESNKRSRAKRGKQLPHQDNL